VSHILHVCESSITAPEGDGMMRTLPLQNPAPRADARTPEAPPTARAIASFWSAGQADMDGDAAELAAPTAPNPGNEVAASDGVPPP